MLELITDRTQQDVARLQALARKGFANMTESERSEWLTPSKGAYNYTDLNRVEEAVAYLGERLAECGYTVTLSQMRTWAQGDVITLADMAQYLTNVEAIRRALATFPTTPAAPASMSRLTFSEANAIEQILTDVDTLLDNMKAAYTYCGDVYGGEMK